MLQYESLRMLLQVMIPEWEPAESLSPKWPNSAYIVDREEEVEACVAHWLWGWKNGRRGRAINVCCQSSG